MNEQDKMNKQITSTHNTKIKELKSGVGTNDQTQMIKSELMVSKPSAELTMSPNNKHENLSNTRYETLSNTKQFNSDVMSELELKPDSNKSRVTSEIKYFKTSDSKQSKATSDNKQSQVTTDNKQSKATSDSKQSKATSDSKQSKATSDSKQSGSRSDDQSKVEAKIDDKKLQMVSDTRQSLSTSSDTRLSTSSDTRQSTSTITQTISETFYEKFRKPNDYESQTITYLPLSTICSDLMQYTNDKNTYKIYDIIIFHLKLQGRLRYSSETEEMVELILTDEDNQHSCFVQVEKEYYINCVKNYLDLPKQLND